MSSLKNPRLQSVSIKPAMGKEGNRMSDMKFTPGPWQIHPLRSSRSGLDAGTGLDYPWHIVPADHANRPIGGSINPAEDLRVYARAICEFNDYKHKGSEEINANANLIAAAPELFEALNRTLIYFAGQDEELCIECGEKTGTGEGCGTCYVITEASAAILKARGGIR